MFAGRKRRLEVWQQWYECNGQCGQSQWVLIIDLFVFQWKKVCMHTNRQFNMLYHSKLCNSYINYDWLLTNIDYDWLNYVSMIDNLIDWKICCFCGMKLFLIFLRLFNQMLSSWSGKLNGTTGFVGEMSKLSGGKRPCSTRKSLEWPKSIRVSTRRS